MKIHLDKIEAEPPHALRARDLRLVLETVPSNWTESIAEVRLANSLEYMGYGARAFFSTYDGGFTIYCRGCKTDQTLAAILEELAAKSLGIRRQLWTPYSKSVARQLQPITQPYFDLLLPLITPKKKSLICQPGVGFHQIH